MDIQMHKVVQAEAEQAAQAPVAAPVQAHHYFVSCVYAWCADESLSKAVERLAQEVGEGTIKRQVAAAGGLFAMCYRVAVPVASTYDIAMFAPSGVECRSLGHIRIINTKGHCVPCDPKE